MVGPDELRAVMKRYPAGVSVVSVSGEGGRIAVTMGSLVSLSLDPALVGVSVGKQNALHELLREAGSFGVSLISAAQESLASRFARGLPPIALWEGVELYDEKEPPLLADSLGWLRCDVRAECDAGDHTFFVGEVVECELGAARPPLVYLDRRYRPL